MQKEREITCFRDINHPVRFLFRLFQLLSIKNAISQNK